MAGSRRAGDGESWRGSRLSSPCYALLSQALQAWRSPTARGHSHVARNGVSQVILHARWVGRLEPVLGHGIGRETPRPVGTQVQVTDLTLGLVGLFVKRARFDVSCTAVLDKTDSVVLLPAFAAERQGHECGGSRRRQPSAQPTLPYLMWRGFYHGYWTVRVRVPIMAPVRLPFRIHVPASEELLDLTAPTQVVDRRAD